MNKWKYISITAAVAIIGVGAGYLLRGCARVPSVDPVVISDTITLHDTTYLAGKTRVLSVRDTIYLTKWDTVEHTVDTTKMLVYQTKQFRDTLKTDSSNIELGVTYSGYDTKIDSIDLKYKFTIQPVVVEKESGWGWSITVGPYLGYGMSVANGQVLAGPQVGIGVQVGLGYQGKFKSLKRK